MRKILFCRDLTNLFPKSKKVYPAQGYRFLCFCVKMITIWKAAHMLDGLRSAAAF